jgi:hypothetical protein
VRQILTVWLFMVFYCSYGQSDDWTIYFDGRFPSTFSVSDLFKPKGLRIEFTFYFNNDTVKIWGNDGNGHDSLIIDSVISTCEDCYSLYPIFYIKNTREIYHFAIQVNDSPIVRIRWLRSKRYLLIFKSGNLLSFEYLKYRPLFD